MNTVKSHRRILLRQLEQTFEVPLIVLGFDELQRRYHVLGAVLIFQKMWCLNVFPVRFFVFVYLQNGNVRELSR